MNKTVLRLLATSCLICATAAPAAAFTAYVSNEKGNSISVIDTDTKEVVKTIKTGNRPRGITISHDGKFIYVCVSDDDTIEVIDAKTCLLYTSDAADERG